MRRISLSVHALVDLILRKGSIDNRVFNNLTMEEGTRLHKWYQSQQESSYYPEYYLKYDFTIDHFILSMEGRADGVIILPDDNITIDEIKTTNADIKEFYESQKEWHLGQAQFYAYMYMVNHNLDTIKVQLTYISQEDKRKIEQYLFIYTKQELEDIIYDYLNRYLYYLKVVEEMKSERQISIKSLEFPYSTLREGQQKLMDFVDEAISTRQIGFCEAKTGIGKTISTLYPSIKKLESENLEKIFYLTSKNSIKEVVFNTMRLIGARGGKLKTVILTSKEHICPNSSGKRHCNPDECPFAKDYYSKAQDIIIQAYKEQDLFREDDILKYALANDICPFELQLDMLNYADVIVGDYNYLFDPTAKLARFFESYSINPFILLIDEAHNLPDRVRAMFSSEISIFDCEYVLKVLLKEKGKKVSKVYDDIARLESFIKKQKKVVNSTEFIEIEEANQVPDEMIDILNEFIADSRKYMKKKKKLSDAFLDFYYLAQQFLALPIADKRWAYYFTFDSEAENCLSFSISCLDSRPLIKQGYEAFQGGVCFSATLTPKDYFIDILGGDKDSLSLYLPSPFEEKNLLVMVNPFISTKYKDRDSSIEKIVSNIDALISGKVGNYFIFFPSFEYMNKVIPYFIDREDIDVFYQNNNMKEEERKAFLERFHANPKFTTLGFIVLGGIFSEGIDLVDDRLIGAVIVSVGLPKINYISSKMQKYFAEDAPDIGYAYAYTYPGINRVFQAAGRVIRSEEDRGVILYIDTRYSYKIYKNNLESMYSSIKQVGSALSIYDEVNKFWKNKD